MAAAAACGVTSTIQSNPQAVGLAVIVSNDYSGTALKPLTGTHDDGARMSATFQALGFATYTKKNVNLKQMLELLRNVTTFKRYPLSYKCITFVFSGHGGCESHTQNGKETELKYLYMQDEKKIEVKGIVTPFLPQNATHIGNIPKLFFIDACRGLKDMHRESVVVPRGHNEGKATCEVLQKGANEVITIDIPREGNFLLAYSTLNEYQSYEVRNDGGVWMKLLSEKLKSGVNDSVTDVLTNVNKELVERFQDKKWRTAMTQPEFICRLLGTVKLHELRSKPQSAAVTEQSPPAQLGDSRQLLNQDVTTSRGCPSHKEQLQEYFINENRPQDATKIKYTTKELKGGFQTTVCVPDLGYEKSDVCQTSKKAENDAARKALVQLNS